MTGRTLHLTALIVATMLLACSAAWIAAPGRADAAFPGENGKLVFGYLYDNGGGPTGIYTVNPDGTEGTEIVRNPDQFGIDGYPEVSPNGRRIVFQRDNYAGEGPCDIFAVNMDGTGLENLTDSPAACEEGLPAWSPDGSKVVFDSGGALYAMEPDGSEKRRLTDESVPVAGGPAWSPDGTKIAFTVARDGNTDVYTMNADGSGLRRLTDDPARDSSPDWSPDGTEIAFNSDRDDPTRRAYYGAIYTMNADGSEERKIVTDTTYPYDPNQEAVFHGDYDPAWSPDGSKIAFTRSLQYVGDSWAIDVTDVHTMNADGSGLSKSYRTRRYAAGTSWQPLGARSPGSAPPETTIFSGPSDVAGTSVGFDFVSSTPGSTFECSLDGAAFAPCEGPKEYAGLPAGEHGFRVRAKGPGGEADPTPAERAWTVEAPEPTDGTAPTIDALRPAPGSSTRDRTPTIRAAVRDGEGELAASGVSLRVDGAEKAFAYDPDTDRLSRTTGRLSYGRHSVRMAAEDAAGNATARTWYFKVVRGR